MEQKRYIIYFAYDGSGYKGLQMQGNLATVQNELQKALAILFKTKIALKLTSRTDAGVHALHQVVSFIAHDDIYSLPRLQYSLNALLPKDISVWKIVLRPITEKLVARQKTYRYQIALGHPRPTIGQAYMWHIKPPFNLDLFKEACQLLIGQHDFSAFRAADCQNPLTIREIFEIKIQPTYLIKPHLKLLTVSIKGNGFLKYMVRIIIGTLVDIAKGRRDISCINQAFVDKNRSKLGGLAPAFGLTLSHMQLDFVPAE